MRDRLNILYVSPMPPSPPRFGAQARMHGLMTNLARRNDLTAVCLVDRDFDLEASRRAMEAYCKEVVVLENPHGKNGIYKRALQLRSLASRRSFEQHRSTVPALQSAIDRLMARTRFDVVNVEFPYLSYLRFDRAGPRPPVVVDAHDIAYDIVRQFALRSTAPSRRLYGAVNWRKLRREELGAFRKASAVTVCSVADQERVRADDPAIRTVVVPNAADVDLYKPRPEDPAPDGRSVVFFGLLATRPNIDGATWFVNEVWPHVVRARPDAQCKIIGKGAGKEILDLARPGVEIVGFVEDLRPHLARAAAIVVPLRLGSGTRLKIVEGMAMGKAIVSTTLGAEGIDVTDGQNILVADEPPAFAAAVVRLMGDPELAASLGAAARKLAVDRYAWSAAADQLENLFRELIAARERPHVEGRSS
jgi:glycosyltransferase involved in cell wall biosynthesis